MKPLRFSQRIGKVPVRQMLQVDGIDETLTNRLWNHILIDFLQAFDGYKHYSVYAQRFFNLVWLNFFKEKIDEIPSRGSGIIVNTNAMEVFIRKWFLNSEWYGKYDFIEYLVEYDHPNAHQFREKVNQVLKEELSGYTIINNQIVPITSEHEISSIEEALNNSSKYSPVETHLQKALEMLSDRQSPDYRNSIKESISAVEAYCKILTGDSKATLGEALKQMEKSHKLHSALKVSFTALYGYTSDSGGIRHSLLEDDISVTFEDAKFMLVSCSAFFNYLKARES